MSEANEGALILRILWRMIVVSFGFASAIVMAGILLASVLSHDIGAALESGYEPYIRTQLVRGFVLIVSVAGVSFILWAIGTLISEILQYRSIFYHLGLGALCGAAGGFLHPIDAPRMLQISIATGMVAGLTYWLIAGRRAGDWWPKRFRETPPPPPPSGVY